MTIGKTRSSLVMRLHRSKTRAREGLVLIEGVRAVIDALEAGVKPRFAVLSPRGLTLGGDPLAAALRDHSIEAEEVSDQEFDQLAATETGQGVLMVAVEPDDASARLGSFRRIVVLDAIQDPGNVGTLIRTAAALGADAVVALDGTADPWSAKAVRSAAGAAFRIPITRMAWSDFDARWPGRVLIADGAGQDISTAPVELDGPWALAIGSEGHGPRPELAERADLKLAIPLAAGVESLNAGVAGAILLFALLQQDRP